MSSETLPDDFFDYTSDVDETVTGIVQSEFQPTVDDAGIVVLTGDRPGRAYRIDRELTIGRSPDCGINIRLPDVSRRHARIRRFGPMDYRLEDLNSHNGTSVNGTVIKDARLAFGDRLTIGKSTILLFTHHDPIEERLRHRQRVEMLGRLAGGIAHDFNNLLGTVATNVSYLSGMRELAQVPNPDLHVVLDDLRVAVRRASELTRKLLLFARPSPYQEKPVNLAEVILETAGITKRTFGPTYEVDCVIEGPMFVLGDVAQIHQLLMNLLINARDAMPNGGRILISAAFSRIGPQSNMSGQPAFVVMTVKDEGMGMDQTTLARVFEPFFTTKAQGTGLGLATVQRIVKEHGGEISVDSSPGKGSTFRILLPASPEATSFGGGPEQAEAEPRRRLRILLVDDEDMQLRASQRLLEQCEHSVLVARSGKEALALFERHRHELELAMLDIMMPEMSGPEVCRKLKALDPNFHILGVSGCSDITKLREMEAAGAEALLYKPFTLEALESALREAFNRA